MELNENSEKLVQRCKDGERAAFEELFAMYQPRLKYFIRHLNGDGRNSDDMLQDIWLRVIKKIKKLNDVKSFNVWLYRIARNKVYDGFRRKERFVKLPEDDEISVSGCDEPVFDADDAKLLHESMKKLKSHHKEVLTLSFIEQMSYKSIAEVIGCNVGTVRSRIFYAKKSLRKEMERHNGR